MKKSGFYINAKDKNGLCLPSNSYYHSCDFPLRFGENILYTCQQSFTKSSDFNNFCSNMSWNNLRIYSLISEFQFLGINGNAKLNSPSDWYNVINDYNFTNSTLNGNTCTFPNKIVIDIQYSKDGIISNPQNYIVSARISTVSR